MSIWQQIVTFAFKGLKRSYYWKHFLLGCIPYIAMIILVASTYNTHAQADAVPLYYLLPCMVIVYSAGAFLYPFARFAYESIVGFIMGNAVIISSIKNFFLYKLFSYLLLVGLSWFIAPIGLIILFFYNKHQFKLVQQQTLEQNQ